VLNAISSAAVPAAERVERALDEYRAPVAEELLRIVPADSPLREALYDPIRAHALKPGKGLRPAICLATCRALGGTLAAALPTAAVLELYHNAFLVHDDVEDGSLLRRDAPALHSIYGVPMAVNAGDAMFALAFAPLVANARLIGLGKTLRVLDAIAKMSRETVEGQAIELDWIRSAMVAPPERDYVNLVEKKTAAYSFVAPVEIGAVIAGAAPEAMAPLTLFARRIGVAFQIRDDVLNLRHGARWGKDALDDLWEGKRSLALSHALTAADDDERARAAAILAKPRPTPKQHAVAALLARLSSEGALAGTARAALESTLLDENKRADEVRFLAALIDRAGSLDHAQSVATRYADEARTALAGCDAWLRLSRHRDFLFDLIEFVRQRDH